MTHANEFESSGTSPTPDFLVKNHFTIFLLSPQTPAARSWVETNLPAERDRMQFGGAIVVEHRYIEAIVRGAIADGFSVSR